MAEPTAAAGRVTLSNRTLGALSPEIARPRYDRARLTPGIVHIGLGNFHRAHQAWYLHRLMQDGQALDWAIIGAGVRPADAAQRARLMAQDWLTTLIALDPAGISAEVIGPMIDFLPVEADNAALIDRMADPAIRIVSVTVTEGGYYIDPATGRFDSGHPDIQHDIAEPTRPCTAFGAIVAALARRRVAGYPAFTAMSCDNLQGNGSVLRQTVVSLARRTDAALADWIDTQATFPNSMVDCIVPATGATEIALAQAFGIDDHAPVTHENYRQWVIEDLFAAGRPPWEAAGVTISDRVHVFEAMKIRILNGGHQVIAPAGDLLGHATIAEAMADPMIRALLRKVVGEEIAPHVAPTPERTAHDYLDLVEARFANPRIADTTRRVAFDGSSRQPGFIVPSVIDGLDTGTSVRGLALVSAIWSRYCEGVREDRSLIEPNDPHWSALGVAARAARDDPAAWLAMRQYYGDLGQAPVFAQCFAQWRRFIDFHGVAAAIRAYVGS